MDEGGVIDVVYFDLMKAFDKVPHLKLQQKIEAYGITDKASRWIKSFLSNRRQRVLVNGEISEWTAVTSGVPQGSILGPILFILYINDLPSKVHCNITLFADDTKLYTSINTAQDHMMLQEDIDCLVEWSNIWNLSFHPEKCKVMRIGSNKEDLYNYSMNGNILNYTEEECDLGLTIDCKLNFESHISSKINKANKIMGLIRRSFTFLDKHTFNKLFKAFVRPNLEYANTVWDAKLKRTKNLIENVQRRATKYLPCCKDMNYSERLVYLNLPCLVYRKIRGDMIEVYKLTHDHYDEDVDNPITPLIETARRTRGHTYKIKKTTKRTTRTIRRRFLTNRCVNMWNNLPEEAVTAPSVKSFEMRLDKYWSKFDIMFNYDKCIRFEEQMISGLGTLNLTVDNIVELDLDI